MNSPPVPRKVASLLDLTQVETIYQLAPRDLVIKTARTKRAPHIVAGLERLSLADIPDIADAIYAELDDDQEHFAIIACDAGWRPYAFKVIASGHVTDVEVPTCIVWRHVFLFGAQSLILMHNHPSTDLWPSIEDLRLTQRLRTQSIILNTDIIDHIIYSPETGIMSMRAQRPDLWPAEPRHLA